MPAVLRYFGWPLFSGILLALLLLQSFPQWFGLPAQNAWFNHAPISYAGAVKLAAPAVANLYSSRAESLDEDNDADSSRPAEGTLGSAVILRSDGYLLTNYHVIAKAEQIIAVLHDGREVSAELIGSDPETDLAVLKVPLKQLPTLTTDDASPLQIGDVVLAIGNPLGVGQTVTMGIVSATGRHQLGLNTYEDFIQTDAAINQGNSGGALINTNGRLVGINTAVLSGGSQGIGFSIPVNLALEVMNAIIKSGQVTRGWLGLEAQPLSEQQLQQLAGSDSLGISISAIYANGPAHQAGLQVGDILLRIDGHSASNGRASMHQIARSQPGTPIKLEILRQGQRQLIPITIGTRPLSPPPATP